MSVVREETPRERSPGRPGSASRWLGGLLVVAAALILVRAMSEGVYDIAFANLALDLSGLVSTVGLVYFVGYGVEVLASVVAGPLLDRGSPAKVLVVSYLTKIGVFALIGLGSTFLASHLWAIVVAAATVDLVHRVGDMALFVLLPRLLDPQTLIRVQGIGATVRSVAELLSPAVAGAVLVLLPGAQALLVAAGFQALALVLLGGLAVVVRARPASPAGEPPAEAGDSTRDSADTGTADAGTAEPVSRRAVARALRGSSAWRRFVVLDTLTTLAMSSVILSIIPLMREQLDMPAAQAGTFLIFTTAGGVLGGLLIAKSGERGIYPSLWWASALAGVSTVLAPLLGHSRWMLALALVGFGLGFTVYLRAAALVVQLRAPMALLGTWHGLIDAIERIACAAAILATGIAFDSIGGTAVYAGFGGLLVVTAVLWRRFGAEHQAALQDTPLHAPAAARPG